MRRWLHCYYCLARCLISTLREICRAFHSQWREGLDPDYVLVLCTTMMFRDYESYRRNHSKFVRHFDKMQEIGDEYDS